jgi:hypothetical protein
MSIPLRRLVGVGFCVWVFCVPGLVGPLRCEEGMWRPDSLPDEVMMDMQARGLELAKEGIFDSSGTGVANAVVNVGATGSFVSAEGLILTNHHVAYGAVQRISTAEKNYIQEGFLARTRDEEVPAHGYRANVLLSSEDVTHRVLDAVTPEMSPLERYDAIERATKAIIRDAEQGGGVYCEVNSFYGGSMYLLDTYLRLLDVRVVYVPARSIGEYGGDIDNWMWPRHAGDFSFLRAYVGPDGSPAEYSPANVPYRPTSYLKVAKEGLRDSDLAIVIGYPGRTYRYLTSYELAYKQDLDYPEHVRLYREILDVIYRETEADPEGAVRVASRVKNINNRLKNNLGMIDGFERFGLVARQVEKERAFTKNLEAHPAMKEKYGGLLDDFRSVYEKRLQDAKADLILEFMVGRGTLLSQAMLLYKWSIEKQKDDMDRDPDFMDREIPRMKTDLRVFQMGYHEASDREVLRMLINEALSLPPGQRLEGLDRAFGPVSEGDLDDTLRWFLDRLYSGTHLNVAEDRLRLFGLSHDDLLAENDPFIDLAGMLYGDNEARLEREKAFEGTMTLIRPRWIRALADLTGHTVYPDANGTMRLNY